MKGKIFLTTILVFCLGILGAQDIHEDDRIGELLQLHIAYNEAFPVMPGYRIQLFMESGNAALDKSQEVIDEFEQKHDSIPAYITFGEPYYRVRIGDFRTRLEAIKFLDRIQRSYPQAWVVKDKINFPKLSIYQKTNEYE